MGILDPRALLAVLLVGLVAFGLGHVRQARIDAKDYADERKTAAIASERARNAAINEARAEEQRRANDQSRIADEATKQAEIARGDARTAGVAADKLRQRVAELVAASRAAGHSAAAGAIKGQPGGEPLDVLIDVLRRTDGAAGELGEYADRLRLAGLACERSYDALRGGEK